MLPTLAFSLLALLSQATYEPTWESLDSRPNPQWFEDAKFGVFIVWGVYSVPAWGPRDRYAEWYGHDMNDKQGPTWAFHVEAYGEETTYRDFAPRFTAEMFDPEFWADIIHRSGARYVVHTAKFHDGYSLWPDEHNPGWNAVEIGPGRDLVGEISEALRKRNIRVGAYYSFLEWFHPLYTTDIDRYVDEYMLPQMKDFVERYKPDILWPDGEWDHPSATWRSPEFLAWLFNESSAPNDVAVNDRWGRETRSRRGGFATPEYQHRSPGPLMDAGRFEECQGMGKSFGLNRNERAEDYRSTTELLRLLVDTVSRGGNLLLDIGPAADGRIPEIMQERLLDMGRWLRVNGDAIYATTSLADAPEQNDLYFTRKDNVVYVISFAWPGPQLILPDFLGAQGLDAVLLGHDVPLNANTEDGTITIDIPCLSPDALPCDHAWTVRLEGRNS